jgi:hypothetical protein
MTDTTLLDAARAIRPYLDELLGDAAAADELDRSLAELLAAAGAGAAVDEPIERCLRERPATLEWTAFYLKHQVPLQVASLGPHRNSTFGGGYSGLPGPGEPVRAERYSCPGGDYLFYRRDVGQPIPTCPTHGLALERSEVR